MIIKKITKELPKLKLKWICLNLLVLLICFSCKERETYYHFEELKDAKWSKLDTLYFDIDSTLIDLNQNYNITIELTNNSDYPYQNIWLYFQDDFGGNTFRKEEKEYQLADALGEWNGSGFGPLYQLSLRYRDRISFPEKKNYQLKIVHGMIDEPLFGIEKLGVKISPNQ